MGGYINVIYGIDFCGVGSVVSYLYYQEKKGNGAVIRKLEFERRSVINLKEMLEENFIPEIEARKNKIIDEFKEKIYNYYR
jgi:hypothetical protein